jgi:sugar O-acyltransferase (sialic acid O-acetyltransferase NeuD family)
MKNIIIVGAGGFAREVYEYVHVSFDLNEYKFKGFLTPDAKELEPFNMEHLVLGNQDNYEFQENDRVILAIGNVDIRKKVLSKLNELEVEFVNLIHPTAIISENARIGKGVIICPFVVISTSVTVDDFAMINFYSSLGHDSKLGRNCVLSPYSTVNGFAILLEDVFMATHTMVAAYRTIGRGSKISAGSCALYNVKDNSLVYGLMGDSRRLIK